MPLLFDLHSYLMEILIFVIFLGMFNEKLVFVLQSLQLMTHLPLRLVELLNPPITFLDIKKLSLLCELYLSRGKPDLFHSIN